MIKSVEDSIKARELRTDAHLMSGLAEGDARCLAELWHRHHERVLHLAYRVLGRWDMADDVTQETFLRIRRAAPGYQPNCRFTTWLHRVVVNLCHDTQRRRRRQRDLSPHMEPHTDVLPETPIESDETVKRVAAAVNQLPQRQRTALVLHRYEGLSHEEVAEATGWSASAVESLLVRAYAKLREQLVDLKNS